MGEEQYSTLLREFAAKVKTHRETEASLKKEAENVKNVKLRHEKSEAHLQALHTVGQIVGEVLCCLPDKKYIVKASTGPRYIVEVKGSLKDISISPDTRVALEMNTLTIMRTLPRQVDPMVYNMLGNENLHVNFSEIGGLTKEINQLREIVELPLINPEIFKRVGIKAPKGALLYGSPGTGKTLMARALASTMNCNFIKVVASAIVDKYIGESSRIVREIFGYAKEHKPCVIFIDEIDAIGGKRLSQGTSADREIQRTLMELLNQMDGFRSLDGVTIIMATNKPDSLDPALMRPGRLDRKIEVPIPSRSAGIEILKIHASKLNTSGEIDYEGIFSLCDGFNGADIRNICSEAGMVAIRMERDYVLNEDFYIGARKIAETKGLEGKVHYQKY